MESEIKCLLVLTFLLGEFFYEQYTVGVSVPTGAVPQLLTCPASLTVTGTGASVEMSIPYLSWGAHQTHLLTGNGLPNSIE